jgi:hypothetical protein
MLNRLSSAALPRLSAPAPGSLAPESVPRLPALHFTDWRRFALRTGHVPHSPPRPPSP